MMRYMIIWERATREEWIKAVHGTQYEKLFNKINATLDLTKTIAYVIEIQVISTDNITSHITSNLKKYSAFLQTDSILAFSTFTPPKQIYPTIPVLSLYILSSIDFTDFDKLIKTTKGGYYYV